jgi:hypothetical protein
VRFVRYGGGDAAGNLPATTAAANPTIHEHCARTSPPIGRTILANLATAVSGAIGVNQYIPTQVATSTSTSRTRQSNGASFHRGRVKARVRHSDKLSLRQKSSAHGLPRSVPNSTSNDRGAWRQAVAIFTVTSIQPQDRFISRRGIAASCRFHPFRSLQKKGPAYRLGTMGGA